MGTKNNCNIPKNPIIYAKQISNSLKEVECFLNTCDKLYISTKLGLWLKKLLH